MSLAANTIAIGFNDAPYAGIINGVSGKLAVPSVTNPPTGSGNGAAFSPDGSLLAIAHTTTPYVTIYNTADWSKVVNPATLPAGTANGVAFSPDGSLLAIAHATTPYVTIYNTADWSKVDNPAVLPVGTANGADFNDDGSLLAVAHANSPYVTIYNTADWSKVANPSALPPNGCQGCAFSPDGSLLALAHITTPYLTLYSTADWSKLANPANLPGGTGFTCAFSPDGSKLAVGHQSGSYMTVYNTSDWSKLSLDAIVSINGVSVVYAVAWRDNNILLASTNGSPGIVEFDLSTGAIVTTYDIPKTVKGLATLPKTLWAINGTIDEALAADTWVASVHELQTGQTLGRTEFTGTAFSVNVTTPTPVTVTVSAKQGDIWQASESVATGTKRFPTNPSATPYYYEATSGGITAVSEPVWPVTPGGTVADGTVTWTRVERLIQPVTQSPLIPTPV